MGVEEEASVAGPSRLALDTHELLAGQDDQIEWMGFAERQQHTEIALYKRAQDCRFARVPSP
jgi:hypothetical protein